MHSGYHFSELGDSLGTGFLADQIVLVLARAERGDQLSPEDKDVLRKGAMALDAAVEGHKWLDHPTMCESTSNFSASYARAVTALPEVHTPEDFLQHMSALKRVADALSTGKPAGRDEIRKLRTFFFNSSQSELSRTEDLLKGESSPEMFLKWKASGE